MKIIEELLKEWNGGILRGAKTNLASKLDVGTAVVSDWTSGRIRPGEANIKKMAKLFNKSEEDVRSSFGINESVIQRAETIKNHKNIVNQVVHNANMEIFHEKFKTIEAKLDLLIQMVKGK